MIQYEVSVERPPLNHLEGLLKVRLNDGWEVCALDVITEETRDEGFFWTETIREESALVVLRRPSK